MSSINIFLGHYIHFLKPPSYIYQCVTLGDLVIFVTFNDFLKKNIEVGLREG